MKIAIVAATEFEIHPLIKFLREHSDHSGYSKFRVLITGIGVMASTYQLANLLQTEKPRCVIQAGIAGSFADEFKPGELVMVKEERIGDLGVEEDDTFKDVFDMGLMDASWPPFDDKRLINTNIRDWERFMLPVANGVTVNEITTRPDRIRLLRDKYNCDIETMEGAALHYTCLLHGVSFVQIRSISNRVGERNKQRWLLSESVKVLNNKLVEIIQEL